MNEKVMKGEGKKCELKVNEVGEKGNETEEAVRYEEIERIEEEGDGEEYERKREKNMKFTSSKKTHGIGLFTVFLLHKLRAIACNKFSQARPTQLVNGTTDISLVGSFEVRIHLSLF
jgi:hypothetical protein